MDELNHWLFSHGYTNAKAVGKGLERSNSVSDCQWGGTLYVPMVEYTQFLNLLSSALMVTDASLCINEYHGPIFRFFMDFDMVWESDMSQSERLTHVFEILKCVQENLVAFLEDPSTASQLLRCAVCLPNATAPTGHADDSNRIKWGMHFIWPNLYVDTVRSLLMHHHCMTQLKRVFPNDDWDKVMDAGVYYAKNTIRMILNKKGHKDKQNQEIVLVEQRWYDLRCLVGADGVPLPDNTSRMSIQRKLLLTSIRYHVRGRAELTNGWIKPETLPNLSADEVLLCTVGGGGGSSSSSSSSSSGSHLYSEDRRSMEADYKDAKESKDAARTPEMMRLQEFIRTQTDSAYRSISIQTLFRISDTCFILHFDGEGATFCLNYGRMHNSAHIYAMVLIKARKAQLRFGCFCRHDTVKDRITGQPCKEYIKTSTLYPLPKDLGDELFPTLRNSNARPSFRGVANFTDMQARAAHTSVVPAHLAGLPCASLMDMSGDRLVAMANEVLQQQEETGKSAMPPRKRARKGAAALPPPAEEE